MEDVKHWQLLLPSGLEGNLTVENLVYPFVKYRVFLLEEGVKPRLSGRFPPDYVLYPFALPTKVSTAQTDLSPLLSVSVTSLVLEEENYALLLSLLQDIPEDDGDFGADLQRMMGFLSVMLFLCPLVSGVRDGICGRGGNIGNDVKQGGISLVSHPVSPRVRPILLYIDENLSEPLSLEQIASQFFISKTYLCRLFKGSTGVSVMEYMIEERISRACILLEQGYSVQKVGELSGFSDNSHFIRTFRKRKGVSPGKYGKGFVSGQR